MDSRSGIDVIVIGGGASGMMAAISAARHGRKVLILEKNKVLGNKLSITGGGRCNITNTNPNYQNFVSNYGEYAKFLHSPLSLFGVQDTVTFFESLGIDIVTEARYRAFPKSQSAKDVTTAMRDEIKKLGISIRTGEMIKKITTNNGKITSVITNNNEYTAHSYIIATGGISHPETGSTGDGFVFLKNFGHKVHNPKPSIVPLKVHEAYIHKLSGVSVENMKISFYVDGKKEVTRQGKILFTHFGVSGPLILNCASTVSDLLHKGEVTAKINMLPDLDERAVEQRMLLAFDANKNKSIKNVFPDVVPDGISSVVLEYAGVDQETKVHSVTKEERKKLRDAIVAFPMTIDGLMGFDRAVIADGGVDLSEIDMKTMRSKKISNLFVTGDLLHINRPSGGFSLQLCWTTGYIAGANT